MFIDSAQSRHANTTSKLVHHPYVRHPVLTAQIGEFPPRRLLWQHFNHQVYRMHRREQAQQVNAKELG